MPAEPAETRPKTVVREPACRVFGGNPGTAVALERIAKEGAMAHVLTAHLFGEIGRFFEHAAAVTIGFVMMVVGLALGVTMIMLPVGIVVGLLGVAVFVGGIFARVENT
jgi:hypothetical protein